MAIFVPLAVFGVTLLLLGVWGRRHAAELAFVPGTDNERISDRARVMRRGAITCVVVGGAFLTMAVVALVFPP